MLCKFSEIAISIAKARIFPGIFLLLNIALLAWCPTIHAQIAGNEKAEGSISGTVYSQGNNRPAAQVAVSVSSHEAGVFRSVLTDYDGHFEVSGLARGTYEIRIEEMGYQSLRTSAQLGGPSVEVQLHLIASTSPQTPRTAYTISVRELKIPGKAHEEFNKGLQSLAKKDFAASLSHFTKAIQVFPGYYEAFYHQGVAETNLGQLEKAMEAFQKSLDLSGGRYGRGDFGIGYVLYLQGKASEAEAIIRRGLELDGNSADGYVILGMTLLRLNRPDEAEKSAREALLRNPNLANAYLVLADSFARRQNYLEQIQGLDLYLRLEPTGPASQRAHEVREVALRILNRIRPQN